MRRFDDRVVLVTGGGGAIGAAAARRFAAEGARVVVVDRDARRAGATAEAVRVAGGDAIAAVADVGVPDEVDAAFGLAQSSFGRLDAVFNNAGISGTPRWSTSSPSRSSTRCSGSTSAAPSSCSARASGR